MKSTINNRNTSMTKMAPDHSEAVSLTFIALCCAPLLFLRLWLIGIWPLLSDLISYRSGGEFILHRGQPHSEQSLGR
jgi:hypothetical protein